MMYKDPSLPTEKRVEDLLARMSLEEKVAQMLCLYDEKHTMFDSSGTFNPEETAKLIPHGIGHIARPSDRFGWPDAGRGRTIRETVDYINTIQRFVIDKTRLGIPVLFHEEGLHGYMARETTHFPQAIALASTWNPGLLEQIYSIVASEIRCRGVHLVLAPVVDITRDPRWGRVEETFGEDPHLTAEMGIAAVKGFQGEVLPFAVNRVFATLKHMSGHGQPESGTNIGPAAVPERMLRDMFLPPFERAIKEAHAAALMPSFNEIDGIPSHANRFLLTEILRNEWNFQGMVISDYDAIMELMTRHHIADSLDDAAVQALSAGVDVDLPNGNAYRHLPDLIRTGKVAEVDIDKSVRRILRAKFQTGLFDHPFGDVDAAERITSNLPARTCALIAAQQSIVLLKNEKSLLPLNRTSLKKIAVIGPNANDTILGGYSDEPRQTVNILEGITRKLCGDTIIEFAPGVLITKTRGWKADEVVLADVERNRTLIAEAVQRVQNADVAVVVIGDNEQTSREAWTDHHLGDRSSLELVGQQNDLVRAIIETGVPTVVMVINGRPLTINYIAENADAILECWYLGQETGTAVADVLFGDVNPGGKLPITIPRSVGQLPLFYNYKPTARRGYLFDTTEPLYPFGYGLSYTSFQFDNLRLDKTVMSPNESILVQIDISNTGTSKGDEVVQLYIRDIVSSVTRPVKELKKFKRITLAPAERSTISFTLTSSDFCFYNKSMERVVESGDFEIMVGSDSMTCMKKIITVSG